MFWALFNLILAGFQPLSMAALSLPLQSGDVLVQSVKCSLCDLIENEEGLPFSHAGIVWVDHTGTTSVMEAWNSVARISIAEFLSRRRENTTTTVLRPKVTVNAEILIKNFNEAFLGHHYDGEFLWGNSDSVGEKYYCSELIVKLLNPLILDQIQTKPMHYTYHREQWIEYFGHTPPDGKPGISPADLVRSPVFDILGTL